MHRASSLALVLAQLFLLAVVPLVDAQLEAESLGVHDGRARPGVHDAHAFHDHRTCDLCRVLSSVATLAGGSTPAVPSPVPEATAPPSPSRPGLPARQILPVGPRAPPTT